MLSRTALCLLGVVTAAAAFKTHNLFAQPQESLTCPTSTTCPTGSTGSVCEFPLCPVRGFVQPPQFDSGYDIDVDNLANCMNTYQLPVDSMVKSLIIAVEGYSMSLNPQVVIYGPSGSNVTGNFFVTPANQSWYGTWSGVDRASAFGMYSVVVSSSGGPCQYNARAETTMTLSLGYVYGSGYQYSDSPVESLPEKQIGGIIAHVNGLNRPGFSATMSVYQAPANVSQYFATYPVVERFNCAYDVYTAPIICTVDGNYYFKLSGIDAQGYTFMRTNYLQCSAQGGSTTPMPTTTSICLNGGYYNQLTQQCECGFYYEGTVCQYPVCFNGGNSVKGACVCPPGYTDANCLEASCPVPNTGLAPFSPLGRTITLLIQNTQSMSNVVPVIQDYISELYYDFQQQNAAYVTNYIVVAFNPNGATLLANTNDANTLFEAVLHLAYVNSTLCNQQFNKALLRAFAETNPAVQSYSDTYIFTNSPPDTSNSTANLQVYDSIERYKNSLFFYIYAPASGFCSPYSSSDFQRYRDLAQFSGGLALLLQNVPSTVASLQMVPTSYERQQTYQKSFADCTNSMGIDIYVPIDAHTGSVQVAVQGILPAIDIYRPDGSRFSYVSLLDDRYSKVQQVITPCPVGWNQFDNKCFSGSFTSASWYDANSNCIAMGGNLITILNQEKQQFADKQSGGVNYWLGLNKVQPLNSSVSPYSWSTPPNNIPLGHQYTNWGPGQPTTAAGADCVWAKFNTTTGASQWYNVDCYQKQYYVCESHTLNFESPAFPAGIYHINFNTRLPSAQDNTTTSGVYNKNCLVTVNAQSNMQLFYGYNTDSTSNNTLTGDTPTYEPSGSSSNNRFVANFTNLDETLATVSMVEFYDLNYNLLQAKQFTHRTSPCAYRYVSDVFSCPQNNFATLVTGIDDKGFTFNRYDWGVCLGTSMRERFA